LNHGDHREHRESFNNHFTIVEIWKDDKALDTHAVAEHTKKFRDTFGPFSGALFDERIYKSVG